MPTYHKKKVDIVQSEVLQTLFQTQLHTSCVGSPDLGDDKDILTLDPRLESLLQALADLLLIAVAISAVNQLIANLQSVSYSGLDLARLALPCAW